MEYEEVGPGWRKSVTGGTTLKDISCPWTLPLSLSLLPGHHEVSSFASPHLLHHDVLLNLDIKRKGFSQLWTETMSQNK
jgi:hypothetical protein